MCGRYFLRLNPELLKALFGTENMFDFSVNLNASPTQFLPIIVRGGKNTPRAGAARWGLLPSHVSHDDKVLCSKLKNARSETLLEKKSFSDLWMKGRRCLIPASGFFEWPEEKEKGHPGFEIRHGEAVGFAGIWNKRDDLITFTILTTQASSEISGIHSRMPVMFDPSQTEQWLNAIPEHAYQMIGKEALRSDFEIMERSKPISQNAQPVLV